MSKSSSKCAVVIPCYTYSLSKNEHIALKQCIKILGDYDVYFIAPEGLISPVFEVAYGVKYYDRAYFDSKKTYSRLMLTPKLYIDFKEYEYILIYQLDAFVFKDRLVEFCDYGLDYIGAPWPYGATIHTEDRSKTIYVGNGGFSLRKIDTFIRWTKEHKGEIMVLLDYYDLPEDDIVAFIEDMRIAERVVAMEFAVEKVDEKSRNLLLKHGIFGAHNLYRHHYDIAKRIYSEYGYEIERPDKEFSNVGLDSVIKENAVFEYNLWDAHIKEALITLLPDNDNELILWGSGLIGNRLRMLLTRNNIGINAFLETIPNQMSKYGIRILKAEDYIVGERKRNIIIAFSRIDAAELMLKNLGYERYKDYASYDDIIDWLYKNYVSR